MSERIAVLGLGTMGGRVAARMAAAGHDVVGFDPSPEARDRWAHRGGDVAADAATAVGGADLVLVSVPRPEHVSELVAGGLRATRPGSTVVDLSTIDPSTARAAAQSLAELEVVYLDSPVLGRPAGCGSWTLVAGGPADHVEAVTPALEATIARRVVRVGDVGAGSTLKILNNLMFGAINAVTAEAVQVGREAGLEPAVLVDAIVDSGAATVSNLFRDIGPRLVSGDEEPVFALDLLAKDNRLAQELAGEVGIDAPIAEAVARVNARALELGHGSRDSIAVVHGYRSGDPT